MFTHESESVRGLQFQTYQTEGLLKVTGRHINTVSGHNLGNGAR